MLARVVMTWSCEDLPGFGVGAYSDIDPRARALLTITSKHIAANPAVAVYQSHDYICRAWARKISLAAVEGSHFVKRVP